MSNRWNHTLSFLLDLFSGFFQKHIEFLANHPNTKFLPCHPDILFSKKKTIKFNQLNKKI